MRQPIAKMVEWGEFKLASSPDSLATFGVRTCVAVALYDEASGRGSLGHFYTIGADVNLPLTKMTRKFLRHVEAADAVSSWVTGTRDSEPVQPHFKAVREQTITAMTQLGIDAQNITVDWLRVEEATKAHMVLDCSTGICEITKSFDT